MALTEAQKKADLKYKQKTYTTMAIGMHKEKDSDILEYMRTIPNKREYIKELIRKDMNK